MYLEIGDSRSDKIFIKANGLFPSLESAPSTLESGLKSFTDGEVKLI